MKKKTNVFTSLPAVTVSLYVYAFVVSVFLSFSLSTWLFGFVITKFGGSIELFMSWLLVFGFLYVFDGFAMIRSRVKTVMSSEKPEETLELKALSSWFLSYTAVVIVVVIASGFFAENMVFKEIKKAADKGLNVGIIKAASENRQGVNGAESLNAFVFSKEGQDIIISASITQSKETFAYFLERKWTPEEKAAAAGLILNNKPKLDALRKIIKESDYIQLIKLPLPGQKDLGLINPYGYSLLEEYARQLAIEAKLNAASGNEKQAAAAVEDMVKLFELLKSDASGLMSKYAAIKVQTVITPAFGAMMSYDKTYRLLRPFMISFIEYTRNGLTRSALREDTALLIEKYRLIKKNQSLIKFLTGVSGPMVSLAAVTGALDISFYRLIKDFSEASEEINIREYTNVKTLPAWPYIFTKVLEPDLIRFYRDEAASLAFLKALNVLASIKDYSLKEGKLPKSMTEAVRYLPKLGAKDPYGNNSDFLIIYKGDYMILYSVGNNNTDDAGSIADNRDIGHLLTAR